MVLRILAWAGAMLILILDAKTGMMGAKAGIELCFTTVIPALFPFFIVSPLLLSALMERKLKLLRPIGRLLKIPQCAEPLLLVGLLGGYPVGAQGLADAYRRGKLSKQDAERMLSFCNNAGPAFLFGMGAAVLQKPWLCWIVWGIHILSALITGILTPGKPHGTMAATSVSAVSLADAMKQAMRAMASVCGWVVALRVLLSFLQRWAFWLFPKELQIIFSGLLEVANGCVDLIEISQIGQRLTIFALFISFGGVCVMLQTKSAVSSLFSCRNYFLGKVMQSAVTLLFCEAAQLLLEKNVRYHIGLPAVIGCILICILYGKVSKKLQIHSSNPVLLGV